MSLIPLASHFLAGSLISLLMPVGLLIAIVIWYMLAVKRVPGPRSKRSELPSRGNEPQAGPGGPSSGSSAGNP